MSKQVRGLGKGLGALLGSPESSNIRKPVEYINKEVITESSSTTIDSSADIMRIPVEMIEPNPFQPRITFNEDTLTELVSSIKNLGLIQPVTVRKVANNRYQIISGERRFRACKLAGMTNIPSYIRDTNDQGMLEMGIVENIQRQDLDPIEIALGYQRLIEECHLTQEKMAERVGKKRASITNYIRLLKLPAKVQHDIKVGLLSVGHAKVILGIDDIEVQEKLCDLVVKDELSVRQLENLIHQTGGTKPKSKAQNVNNDLPEDYYKVLDVMGKYFNNNISIKRANNGKGSITLNFNSDEEVTKFLKALDTSNL